MDKTSKTLETCRRARGELSVRLLSRSDSVLFPAYMSLPRFTRGSKVVVIDMRVFVPQVISVLATLASSSFEAAIERVPFGNFLLGNRDDRPAWDPFSVEVDGNDISRAILWKLVHHAVYYSSIDCLKILSSEQKRDIATEICEIKVVQTLDRTQGYAFAAGLSQTLNCTLGPPGSGKSYVGVCLVLALMKIRSFVQKLGKNVGPIIALSYKNHALDEFLLDVLRHGPDLRKEGKLIRVGKPEAEELMRHTERRSEEESRAKRDLESCIKRTGSAKLKLDEWTTAAELVGSDCASTHVTAQCLLALHEYFNWRSSSENDRCSHFDILTNITKIDENLGVNGKSVKDVLEMLFSNDLRHWIVAPKEGTSRYVSLLEQWLAGEVPPPRCAFVSTNQNVPCDECAEPSFEYCHHHRCERPNCGDKCSVATDLPCHSCDAHRCCSDSNIPCHQTQLLGLTFCLSHSCSACGVAEKRGPYVCEAHSCILKDCQYPQLRSGILFCFEHCCKECASADGITAESYTVQESYYCKHHKCAEEGCKEVSMGSDKMYCDAHTCLCCDNYAGSNIYCSDHRCNFDGGDDESCKNGRVYTSDKRLSFYCAQHTCRFCVDAGNVLDETCICFFGTDTCDRHPTCQVVDERSMSYCGALCEEIGEQYCIEHKPTFLPTIHCCGITSKQKPCQTIKPATVVERHWYCTPHEKQRDAAINPGVHVAKRLPLPIYADQPVVVRKARDAMAKLVNLLVTCQGADCTSRYLPQSRPDIDQGAPWYCAPHRIVLENESLCLPCSSVLEKIGSESASNLLGVHTGIPLLAGRENGKPQLVNAVPLAMKILGTISK
jgi:hypothetical protein